MFTIKIDNKYVESFIFRNKQPEITLCSTTLFALKFENEHKAKAIIKSLGKGELELI